MKILKKIFFVLLTFTIISCSDSETNENIPKDYFLVKGIAAYKNDLTISKDAITEITLVNNTNKNIIKHEVIKDTASPIKFSLLIKKEDLEPSHTYSLQVDIRAGKFLLFTSNQKNLVNFSSDSVKLNKRNTPIIKYITLEKIF